MNLKIGTLVQFKRKKAQHHKFNVPENSLVIFISSYRLKLFWGKMKSFILKFLYKGRVVKYILLKEEDFDECFEIID